SHLELWNQCRQVIADNLSTQQFTAWFSDVHSVSFNNGELRLSVPSPYFSEQLEERFASIINAAIKKVYGTGIEVVFMFNQVSGQPESKVEVHNSKPSATIMNEIKAPIANPFAETTAQPFRSQLNALYNFENYCIGQSNRVAYTIAESIANDPSNKTFNPLFVFGPTGVGKTHLIQAIGVRIKERNPQARVLYVTARLFQAYYTAANHKGHINDFFKFYQSIDTLIIDDVQDIAGNPGTQNTFFHIFNQLHQNNRQIILSSDCAPSEMEGFEARLLNRFKWGASAALEKPDLELRRQVLRRKSQTDGLELPEDVIEYVAANVTDSIRELEGVVASLVAHATVLNCEITLDFARPVVANAVRIRRSQVNFEMISEAVASYFKINPDIIFTKTRKREISDARQMIMYLSKKLAGMSFKSIGNTLGRT
ncbi:MAG: chromosomal replication initiator protein DnaA, partial [Muribaculaceae bacterium]|nr:chromosomal replication initiator protein DnaA [Muribaculaceae bacterium]